MYTVLGWEYFKFGDTVLIMDSNLIVELYIFSCIFPKEVNRYIFINMLISLFIREQLDLCN